MDPLIVFSGNPLDRAGARRNDIAFLDGLLAAGESRALGLWDLRPAIRLKPAAHVAWMEMSAVSLAIRAGAPWVFLGIENGAGRFAVDLSGLPAPTEPGVKLIDVRSIAPNLEAADAAILAEARSMLDWHARHRFCAACGQASEPAAAGWHRVCPGCKAQHFPRTDPVVIMLAIKGERCLLGRQARFVANSYSALAGFVEHGETLEEAVRREMEEEAGIKVGKVRYFASQPWPFPASLMIGCFAEATSEAITLDQDELEDAKWFHRDEVREMIRRVIEGRDDGLRMPPPLAIAHQLAKAWIDGAAG
ncbi:MAG: NAD(+) diphosphatase [Alphaproteobacteria bacterium]|nr:NAD(+) diphosphatase [Alphaproteobacteria bacterium]